MTNMKSYKATIKTISLAISKSEAYREQYEFSEKEYSKYGLIEPAKLMADMVEKEHKHCQYLQDVLEEVNEGYASLNWYQKAFDTIKSWVG